MPTHFLLALADQTNDLTNAEYDSLEKETRSALLSIFVPESDLDFDAGSANNNWPGDDRYLYLGTHRCGNRKTGDVSHPSIELAAYIAEGADDDTGQDYVDWCFVTAAYGGADWSPIIYCPFCGMNLKKTIHADD
jgi:hypothetical protein